jgi:hypothetical protein
VSQPQPVGGGAFDVDISQAPRAIRQLEDARRELESIKNEAVSLGGITPPTRDQVSVDAALVLSMTATQGPGSFVEALNSGIEEISRLIQALRSSFDQYQRNDDDGASTANRT